jgi:hypothetical protein
MKIHILSFLLLSFFSCKSAQNSSHIIKHAFDNISFAKNCNYENKTGHLHINYLGHILLNVKMDGKDVVNFPILQIPVKNKIVYMALSEWKKLTQDDMTTILPEISFSFNGEYTVPTKYDLTTLRINKKMKKILNEKCIQKNAEEIIKTVRIMVASQAKNHIFYCQ